MERKIILRKKDDTIVEAKIQTLNISYMDKILSLQENIYAGLDNKDYFCCTSKESFAQMIEKLGEVIGCVVSKTNELIAVGAYVNYGYNEDNYAYDLGFKGDDVLTVGQIDTTVVHKDYRGNKLQKTMCTILEEIAKQNGDKIITATAAPDNKYSVNTFLDLGYEIVADKLKYGGLRRYVFKKDIQTFI